MLEQLANDKNVEVVSAGIFDSAKAVETCFAGRTDLALTSFESMLCGDKRVTLKDHADVIVKLRAEHSTLTLLDLKLLSEEAWVSFWGKRIQGIPITPTPAEEDESQDNKKDETAAKGKVEGQEGSPGQDVGKDEAAKPPSEQQKQAQTPPPEPAHSSIPLCDSCSQNNPVIPLYKED